MTVVVVVIVVMAMVVVVVVEVVVVVVVVTVWVVVVVVDVGLIPTISTWNRFTVASERSLQLNPARTHAHLLFFLLRSNKLEHAVLAFTSWTHASIVDG